MYMQNIYVSILSLTIAVQLKQWIDLLLYLLWWEVKCLYLSDLLIL